MSHLCDDRRWRRGSEFLSPSRSKDERRWLTDNLPELLLTEELILLGGDSVSFRMEAVVQLDRMRLPIYAILMGSEHASGACLMTAGMHGVERIGTQVLLAFLRAMIERKRWDDALQTVLERACWIVVPILNPGGMSLNWRANPNGVDLNRNAPIDALKSDAPKPLWLGGGQTLSARLPWFRGCSVQGLEVENQALQRLMVDDLTGFNAVLALDLHSGFGARDRLWFPYAYRRRPIDTLPEFMALKLLWENSFPPEAYQFEPQSAHYLAHGDMWDYLYRKLRDDHTQRILPLTLELGSWRWLKKRPLHIFRQLGLFHPLVPRRVGRACRDHYSFLMFMLHASASLDGWLPRGKSDKTPRHSAVASDESQDLSKVSRKALKTAALTLWYPDLL